MSSKPSRREKAEAIALWRYNLIRGPADESWTPKQRGVLVRALAGVSRPGPDGREVRVSRESLDRWIRAWRAGGFDALIPSPRQSSPRTPAEVLDLAASLKRERPQRTAAQVKRIIEAMAGDAPSESTLLRHFRRLALPTVHGQATGRFEADFVGEIFVGDALHGVKLGGRKTYLFAFLDDRSRYVVAARWAYSEDTARLAIALKPALQAYGVPKHVYVDNGSAFKDRALVRACARLGIRLVHSAPGRPQGRGKIERFFATVSSEFVAEVAPAGEGTGGVGGSPVGGLEDLNRLFRAWVEECYHRRVNDSTGQAPLDRWRDGQASSVLRRVDPGQIDEAFLWGADRTVSARGTIQLEGNTYQVDLGLAGRRVEVVFDPFDMSLPVRVLDQGVPVGQGLVVHTRRHSHPKAVAALRDEAGQGPAATGIDYLRLLDDAHTERIKAAGIDYTALAGQHPPVSDDSGARL